ncbi:hypothetical protein MTR67_050849 [Solanum verrucosum]|uniref:Uncharacterized protein n=1 Tax=Solanum verrucosum TaxID=315347 RepID=A0AAF0V5A3_SOLVR|nr:hypothetical protein MTR67_050849 [Solanum verrucosum]
MRTIDQTAKVPTYLGKSGERDYNDSVTVSTKGMEYELDRISTLFKTIDLSSNKFEGHIPSSLGDLIALRVLNLSHNRLQGEIPQQLVALTFLSFLNLSHNHLQGCIPQGHQFDTFQNNSYEGNDGLQGFPVSKGCGSNWTPETNNRDYESDDEESNSEFLNDFWKAALMGYGSGLCIGVSIIYIMISTGNLKWLATILEKLDHKIIMRQIRKNQSQRKVLV